MTEPTGKPPTLDDFKVGDRWLDQDGDEHEILAVHKGFVISWFADLAYNSEPDDGFLVKKVVPKQVRYLNVYPAGPRTEGQHLSRESADAGKSWDRIACVRVEFEEGQFDD